MRKYLSIAGVCLSILCVAAVSARAVEADDKDIQVLRAFSRAVSKVAAEVRPGVVSVHVTKTVKMSDMRSFPFPFDAVPFDDPSSGRTPFDRAPRERKFRQQGLGSGFIIDAEKGYVVTNNHVIDGAQDIKVRLADKRELDAKLIGTDEKTDVAVLQVTGKDLKQLKLGDSDKLEVGAFVIAVGSPFGLQETVSAGIVSGKGRSGLGIEDYEDFIQTDAAVNMGNSGGPLVDIEGNVVGLNTAILSRTGGSVGVGFAIPINMAKTIVNQLVATGKVTRGWLGVMIQDLSPDVAEKFGLKRSDGALVSQVVEGTPAAKAGLKVGDVIVEFGGKKVENVTKLRAQVAATTPGTSVKVVVIRGSERKDVTVDIGKLTDEATAAAHGEATSESLGVSVQDLTSDLARTLGARVKEGAVVSSVEEDGLAAEKGIKRGDVIVEVDRKPVKNAAEFEAALANADLKKGVLLLVADNQGSRFVVLKKSAKEKD